VRGDLVVTQLLNQFLAVVALVRAQRDAMPVPIQKPKPGRIDDGARRG
jgi:hypothetical protein